MEHHLDFAYLARIDKKGTKAKHKDKKDFKALSSGNKDELLYKLALIGKLLPETMVYQK